MTFQEVDSPHPVFQARAKAQRSLFNVTPQLRQLRKSGNVVSISCHQRQREKPAENLDTPSNSGISSFHRHSFSLSDLMRKVGSPTASRQIGSLPPGFPQRNTRPPIKQDPGAIPEGARYRILLREYKDDMAKKVCTQRPAHPEE